MLGSGDALYVEASIRLGQKYDPDLAALLDRAIAANAAWEESPWESPWETHWESLQALFASEAADDELSRFLGRTRREGA